MEKIFLVLLSSFLIAACGFGCVNRQLAESYGQYLDTAGTEYVEYIESDPALDDNDKAIRRANHEHARRTVDKFKSTRWSW